MIGGGEGRYPAVCVMGGEARDAAHFAERPSVEHGVDALPAGEFAAVPLADHAGFGRAGGQAFVGQPLEVSDFIEHVACCAGRSAEDRAWPSAAGVIRAMT
ncbi:MAG: hypothetical protein U5Q16_00035 [Gammaproteobacteria bacterium]|nr:hypothetical protein [Gammaproteobacteria bacterium]